MTIHNNRMFYVKDKHIRMYDFENMADIPVVTLRRGSPGQYPPPRALSYNPAENSILLTSVRDQS